MFLLGAVFEVLFEFVLSMLLEIGVLIFPGTGHLLAYVASGGMAYRNGRQVSDAMASLIGVVFWLAVAGVVAFLLLK